MNSNEKKMPVTKGYVKITKDFWSSCPKQYRKGVVYRAIPNADGVEGMQGIYDHTQKRDDRYYVEYFKPAKSKEYDKQNKIGVCDE